MQNGPRTIMSNQQSRPPAQFSGRSKGWRSNAPRPEARVSQNAQRSYERYVALAQAAALSGDTIAAENYYQHAEHYFRSMAADRANVTS